MKEERKLPVKLYKFRDWSDENHKKCLTDRELYLAAPKDFNDPFDCRIPNNFTLLDNREKRKDYIDSIINRNYDFIKMKGYDPESEKIKRLEELERKPQLFQQRDNKELFITQDSYIGIISFSARFDSTLMWSHYAKNHTGFCLVFKEKNLRETGIFGMGGNVNYTDELPKIDPRMRGIEKAFRQTYTKSIDWSYEKEYRLTKYYFPIIANKDDRIIKYTKDSLVEIILGLRMSKKDRNEIISIAVQNKIPVYQAKQEPGKFKIIKSPIPNIAYKKLLNPTK